MTVDLTPRAALAPDAERELLAAPSPDYVRHMEALPADAVDPPRSRQQAEE